MRIEQVSREYLLDMYPPHRESMRKLERLYDTPSAELTDSEYLTLCIAHGVRWPGAGQRPYAFMKPHWLFCPTTKPDCKGWVACR